MVKEDPNSVNIVPIALFTLVGLLILVFTPSSWYVGLGFLLVAVAYMLYWIRKRHTARRDHHV